VIVLDASALVAVLIGDGDAGDAVLAEVAGEALAAPHLLPFEVVNVLRRLARGRLVSVDAATLALDDLTDLAVEYWPYELVADRVWELRNVLTAYDASYVAVAEALGARLVTLDRRLARARGVRCRVVVPRIGTDESPGAPATGP
jgi:predicted nucleic acid-binding protein